MCPGWARAKPRDEYEDPDKVTDGRAPISGGPTERQIEDISRPMEVCEASVAELAGGIERPLAAGATTIGVADVALDAHDVARPVEDPSPTLAARQRTRTRLGAGLVLWDALAP